MYREGVTTLEAIVQVLREAPGLDVGGVYEELEARGWLPDSVDPMVYLRFVLTLNKGVITCEGDGFRLTPEHLN